MCIGLTVFEHSFYQRILVSVFFRLTIDANMELTFCMKKCGDQLQCDLFVLLQSTDFSGIKALGTTFLNKTMSSQNYQFEFIFLYNCFTVI